MNSCLLNTPAPDQPRGKWIENLSSSRMRIWRGACCGSFAKLITRHAQLTLTLLRHDLVLRWHGLVYMALFALIIQPHHNSNTQRCLTPRGAVFTWGHPGAGKFARRLVTSVITALLKLGPTQARHRYS